jgi:hypothetical protein
MLAAGGNLPRDSLAALHRRTLKGAVNAPGRRVSQRRREICGHKKPGCLLGGRQPGGLKSLGKRDLLGVVHEEKPPQGLQRSLQLMRVAGPLKVQSRSKIFFRIQPHCALAATAAPVLRFGGRAIPSCCPRRRQPPGLAAWCALAVSPCSQRRSAKPSDPVL